MASARNYKPCNFFCHGDSFRLKNRAVFDGWPDGAIHPDDVRLSVRLSFPCAFLLVIFTFFISFAGRKNMFFQSG